MQSSRLLGWLMAALLLAGCGRLPPGSPSAPPKPTPVVGRDALSFRVPDARADGQTVSLESVKGKFVLLNFTASWVPGCEEDAALLNRLAREYGGRDLAVIGLLVDDAQGDIRGYLSRSGATYPFGRAASLMQAAPYSSVRPLPEKWLLNREHRRVGEALGGFLTEADLRARIEELLGL